MRRSGIISFVFALTVFLLLIPRIGEDQPAVKILGDDYNTGEAKLFPYLTSGIILIISVIMMIQGFLKKRDRRRTADKRQIRDVAILLLICIVYILILTPVGFLLSTPACLLTILLFFGIRKAKGLILIPVFVTGAIFLCFEVLMSIELPKGVLEWMFY